MDKGTLVGWLWASAIWLVLAFQLFQFRKYRRRQRQLDAELRAAHERFALQMNQMPFQSMQQAMQQPGAMLPLPFGMAPGPTLGPDYEQFYVQRMSELFPDQAKNIAQRKLEVQGQKFRWLIQWGPVSRDFPIPYWQVHFRNDKSPGWNSVCIHATYARSMVEKALALAVWIKADEATVIKRKWGNFIPLQDPQRHTLVEFLPHGYR